MRFIRPPLWNRSAGRGEISSGSWQSLESQRGVHAVGLSNFHPFTTPRRKDRAWYHLLTLASQVVQYPTGWPVTKMKPCVCAGSNEDCRYCSGSGYVSDSTRLPGAPPPGQNWVPESICEPRAQEEPTPVAGPSSETKRRPLFSAEMRGCLRSALVQLVLILILFLVIRLVSGK